MPHLRSILLCPRSFQLPPRLTPVSQEHIQLRWLVARVVGSITFKSIHRGVCMRPSDRRERPPGQGSWSRDSAGQDRPRGHRDRRFKVHTGPRKSAHSHLTVTAARVQSTTPTHLAPHSAWPAESNCPGCSPETCCESSAEDLARAGSIHHHCISCSTCAVNVEVTREQ